MPAFVHLRLAQPASSSIPNDITTIQHRLLRSPRWGWGPRPRAEEEEEALAVALGATRSLPTAANLQNVEFGWADPHVLVCSRKSVVALSLYMSDGLGS